MHRYGYGYEYGESPTFSIGYGDEYGDVYIRPVPVPIPAIILVPAISPSPFKLLKYSQIIK